MKPWSRDDTRQWINQLENRLEDIDYYLTETVNWCTNHEVVDNNKVLICSIMTCIWVSNMRNEQISLQELGELLGINIEGNFEDRVYEIGPLLTNLDHEQLLNIVSKFDIEF